MMVPKVATPYDQNPARIALVMKDRRKQAGRIHASVYRVVISLGALVLYAANHFAG